MRSRHTNCTCPECATPFWDRVEAALNTPVTNACLIALIALAVVTITIGCTGVN